MRRSSCLRTPQTSSSPHTSPQTLQPPWAFLASPRSVSLAGASTGDTFRRFVSRVCRYVRRSDPATPVRAADAGWHGRTLRHAPCHDPAATIVSLDGRAVPTYNTISRSAFLRIPARVACPALVPFVRLWCGQQSAYYWWDAEGRRTIHQGESCEQGDALAPAFYALGKHDSLAAADEQLRPGGEAGSALLPDRMFIALRRRLRLPLPIAPRRCGPRPRMWRGF